MPEITYIDIPNPESDTEEWRTTRYFEGNNSKSRAVKWLRSRLGAHAVDDNGNVCLLVVCNNKRVNHKKPYSLQSIVRLKNGDKISVQVSYGYHPSETEAVFNVLKKVDENYETSEVACVVFQMYDEKMKWVPWLNEYTHVHSFIE